MARADAEEALLGAAHAAQPKLGPRARVFVFVVFTQVVQALMSYDGGATQFCTSSLAKSGWSPLALGMLGAMDKFGQVATAFLWGEVLMRRDAKFLLVVGLFWKASCCLLFGRLQEEAVAPATQLSMLASKLGMGVTEALVSVWATVWVQRNAPHDARARWLGLAGTSAGIGSGVGSGVASLWSPVGAFFVQAGLLFAVWAVLLLTPAWMFRFGSAPDEPDAGEMPNTNDPGLMLVQQACRQVVQPLPAQIVTVESVRCPGHFLDASDDPEDDGWKVRLTKGRPTDSWAHFKMQQLPGRAEGSWSLSWGSGSLVNLESVRLPGHYLEATPGETGCIPHPRFNSQSRVKVQINEADAASTCTQFRLHSLGEEGVVAIESVRLPGHYLDATGDSVGMLSSRKHIKVCATKGDVDSGAWARFRLQEAEQMMGRQQSLTPAPPGSTLRRLLAALQQRLWLWTAMAISLSCFVTSGISFLWQNTVSSVWGFNNAWSFGFFLFSTGVGGLVGVAGGPCIFDQRLGGFSGGLERAACLLWCKRMMFLAAVCSTICALLLAAKAYSLVENNAESVIYWELAVLVACVFVIFVLINSIMGTLYGINTDAVSPELRTFAAGLTVSFQNVFGYAFGPLLPSGAAELVGHTVSRLWPEVPWDEKAVDGAKFAVGMGVALAATWALFLFTRLAAVSARLLHISSRDLMSDVSCRGGRW